MCDNRPIGIFDSGLGGLTVVAAIKELLPKESIVYLGDTARVPYGNKSVPNIIKFGINNSQFLANKDVKLIIVACNSVSAVAIDPIKEHFPDTPVIGVIEAGVSTCIKHNPSHITITGTRATINSGIYEKSLKSEKQSLEVTSIPCPLFVPIVEEGVTNHTITRDIIELYLPELATTSQKQLLLLGCTHYPLLKNAISQFANDNVTIIDSAVACAQFTKEFLESNKLQSDTNNASSQFYVTDKPALFHEQSSRFFGHAIGKIHIVELDH